MPRRIRWSSTPQRGRARLHLRGNQSGAVAVEFALVLPILGMLMFGIITFGLAYSDHVALTNAVREGARFAASTDVPATPSDWEASVVQRTTDAYANADNPLDPSAVCAQLISIDSSGTRAVVRDPASACDAGTTDAGTAPADPANVADGSCFVKVWATRPANLNWLLFSTTITLHADSVALYDRTLSCP